jgi:hypothetical protein
MPPEEISQTRATIRLTNISGTPQGAQVRSRAPRAIARKFTRTPVVDGREVLPGSIVTVNLSALSVVERDRIVELVASGSLGWSPLAGGYRTDTDVADLRRLCNLIYRTQNAGRDRAEVDKELADAQAAKAAQMSAPATSESKRILGEQKAQEAITGAVVDASGADATSGSAGTQPLGEPLGEPLARPPANVTRPVGLSVQDRLAEDIEADIPRGGDLSAMLAAAEASDAASAPDPMPDGAVTDARIEDASSEDSALMRAEATTVLKRDARMAELRLLTVAAIRNLITGAGGDPGKKYDRMTKDQLILALVDLELGAVSEGGE